MRYQILLSYATLFHWLSISKFLHDVKYRTRFTNYTTPSPYFIQLDLQHEV